MLSVARVFVLSTRQKVIIVDGDSRKGENDLLPFKTTLLINT